MIARRSDKLDPVRAASCTTEDFEQAGGAAPCRPRSSNRGRTTRQLPTQSAQSAAPCLRPEPEWPANTASFMRGKLYSRRCISQARKILAQTSSGPVWPLILSNRQKIHGRFIVCARPELMAQREDVLAAIGDQAICTINALPRDQHLFTSGVHYGRPGHIKGSVNVPSADLIDPA